MDTDEKLYLTARDAATSLGVSMATLYTYVSRGLLRVQRVSGKRESRYWRSDVERMKRRSGSRSNGGFAALTSDSSITLITQTETFYRGRDVGELAETHSLEAIAALLWETDEARIFGGSPPTIPELDAGFRRQIDSLDFVERIMALVPFMELANPRCFDSSREGFAEAGAGMLRWMAAEIVGCGDRPSLAPLHEQLLEGVPDERRPAWSEVVRRILVLSADHDLDPTTLSARALANTGVTPYRVMLAALMTGEGRRGVQVRVRAAARLLDEMSAAQDPSTPILARLRAGETLPGFGPFIHAGRDTRVDAILSTYHRFLGDDPDILRFLGALDVARDATGLEPQFILVLLAFNRKLPHAGSTASLLRIGRVVGWVAHALEQTTQDVVRPRSLYRGRLPEQP